MPVKLYYHPYLFPLQNSNRKGIKLIWQKGCIKSSNWFAAPNQNFKLCSGNNALIFHGLSLYENCPSKEFICYVKCCLYMNYGTLFLCQAHGLRCSHIAILDFVICSHFWSSILPFYEKGLLIGNLWYCIPIWLWFFVS